nr:hypothetical protein [Tanacetum cinerariifolium]
MVAYLNKSDASEGFNQVIDFLNGSYIKYALTVNPWNTVAIKQDNDVTRLQALVDKKKMVVTEAAIRESMIAKRTSWNKFSSVIVFAVMCLSIGKGFLGVETPLFDGMTIEQEIEEGGDTEEHVQDVTNDDAAQGDDTAAYGEVPTVSQEPSIPSPTPPSPPPQPPQDLPSTSQEGEETREGEQGQSVDIKKVEEGWNIIEGERLKDEESKVDENNQVQGRQAESQAKIYKIDMDHASKVLSMQEDESTEVQEVVDVVTTAKLITEVVTAASETVIAASATISTAEPQVPAVTITAAFNALLPIELTNEEIMNSNAYKEYYAIATGATPPKPKASVRRTRSSYDTSITPPTAVGPRLTTSAKGKQATKAFKAKSLSAIFEVAMIELQQLKLVTKGSRCTIDMSEEELSYNSTDDEGADDEGKDGDGDEEDEGDDGEEGNGDDDDEDNDGEEGNDDDDDQEVEKDNDKDDEEEGNGEEDIGLNVGRDEGHVEEEEEDELYRDVNINQGRGIQATLEVEDSHVTLTPVNLDGMESIFETTSQMNVQTPTSVTPLPCQCQTMTPSTIATITTTSQAPILPTIVPSTIIKNRQSFGSLFGFDNRLRTLEANFSDFMQTNQFARAVYGILGIRENDEFLKFVDANMQKIIKKVTVTLKRRRDDDADKDEEPSVGPNWGSNRRREGKEPESASAPTEIATRSAGRPHFRWKSPHIQSLTQVLTINQLYNPLSILNGRRVIPFEHFINNDLKYLHGGASSHKHTTSITKMKAAYYGHIKWIEDFVPRTMWIKEPIGHDKHALWGVSHWGRKRQQFYGFAVNRESARDVYSKRRIIAVTELKIVEWHSYKHLDWITVRRDDDKLYKFKEGDFKRLRIQDIEDMLLLLRRVEDLQLGVESYQKKLNLTKPDTYRSDLKRKEAYTAYSNPQGFIYQNKDKKNRLMWIDELHKFSDGMLTDVRTALDDRLKGIRMQYLPQSIWRKSDKDRVAAMIQAIDKRLKTRRIIRSLERFVRGRLYEGDFGILQRTI